MGTICSGPIKNDSTFEGIPTSSHRKSQKTSIQSWLLIISPRKDSEVWGGAGQEISSGPSAQCRFEWMWKFHVRAGPRNGGAPRWCNFVLIIRRESLKTMLMQRKRSYAMKAFRWGLTRRLRPWLKNKVTLSNCAVLLMKSRDLWEQTCSTWSQLRSCRLQKIKYSWLESPLTN